MYFEKIHYRFHEKVNFPIPSPYPESDEKSHVPTEWEEWAETGPSQSLYSIMSDLAIISAKKENTAVFQSLFEKILGKVPKNSKTIEIPCKIFQCKHVYEDGKKCDYSGTANNLRVF